MKKIFTTISVLILFACHLAYSQVIPMVFVPVNNGYHSAKEGKAILNTGDTIHGKFQYHKPLFNKQAQIRFFEVGKNRKAVKYSPNDFKQISITGHRSGKIYVFTKLNSKLIYVNTSNDSLQFNNKSLRKLK